MGSDGILQFEQPFFLSDRSAAQENMSLDPHVLDLFDTDNLINIDPQELMMLIFHA